MPTGGAGALEWLEWEAHTYERQRQKHYELIDGFKRLDAVRRLDHLSHLSARLLEADERTAKATIYGLNRAGRRTRESEEALTSRRSCGKTT